MNIIEIENLTHRFAGGRIALDGINLSVREGEFVVIAGCNGSGKTTLLRHLNGLLLPTAGTVKIAEISVAQYPAKARQMVGMVFQDADSQIIGQTVYEDAAFGPENLKLSRKDINDRVSHALEAVHLSGFEDFQPYQLSGGQKRRLAIAGVLAMNPRILVFDEPFSNLDYPGVKQLLRRIALLHRQGHTMMLATHDLEKVLPYSDRLIVMQKGKIVRDGIPTEVLDGIEDFGVRSPREAEPWIPD